MKRLVLLIMKFSVKIFFWLKKIKKMTYDESISREEKYAYLHRIIKEVVGGSGVDLKCYGIENIPEEQGYIITPNHQGMFDALALLSTHPTPMSAVLKRELVGKPIVGTVIDYIEALPMDRSNLRASMKVIKEVTRRLEKGYNYVIFPEGTRSKQGNQMLEFKGGSFKAVIDAKKPIVPVALIDCYKPFDKEVKGKIVAQIHYLKPMYYDEYKNMSSVEIAKAVQSRIQACIDENA